ncbi:MAG: hypothetical protein IPP77_07860 [Bacteroidetes bacterium]|nr:hypothetical protein [Bacteroidota bacterium]
MFVNTGGSKGLGTDWRYRSRPSLTISIATCTLPINNVGGKRNFARKIQANEIVVKLLDDLRLFVNIPFSKNGMFVYYR